MNWLEGLLMKARNILRAPGKSELQNAEQALAGVREDLSAARVQLQAEEAGLERLVAEAMDGEVTAASIGRQRGVIGEARARVADIEAIERGLMERLKRAEHNQSAKEKAALRAKYEEKKSEGSALLRDAFVGLLRSAGQLIRGIAALESARGMAKQLGIDSWPTLWQPSRLVGTWEMELARFAPKLFDRYYSYSHAYMTPDFETQHRAALAQVQPPGPETKVA